MILSSVSARINVKLFTYTLTLLTIFAAAPLYATQQDTPPTAFVSSDSTEGLLNVYLDCGRCDRGYIRREIGFVNYVRDRSLAEVHLFVTDERTGSGGRLYTLSFIGQQRFEGSTLALTYTSNEGDTFDMERDGLAESIKRGLFPYALQTSVADRLSISYEALEEGEALQPVTDPWNHWVFEVYAGGYVEEEASQGRLDVRYGFYARRVTEQWKIQARPYFNHNIRRFETSDDIIRNVSQRHGFDGHLIKSLTNHWSVGLFSDILSSTFSNIDFLLELSPAVEYSLFPYDESSRREITFRYQLLGGYYDYIEQTLFDKDNEYLSRQALTAIMRFQQPWGSVFTALEGSHFLHDIHKNRLEFNTRIRLRIARGLQLDLSGGVEIIHDQLFLPKGDASLDEVLLQRQQLATTFEVSGRIGFSYTFGSIFNNVVNTRL